MRARDYFQESRVRPSYFKNELTVFKNCVNFLIVNKCLIVLRISHST